MCVCVWGGGGVHMGVHGVHLGLGGGGVGGVPLLPDLQVVLCLIVQLAKCNKMAAASGPIAITIPL